MFLNLNSRQSREKRPIIKVKHDNPTSLCGQQCMLSPAGGGELRTPLRCIDLAAFRLCSAGCGPSGTSDSKVIVASARLSF